MDNQNCISIYKRRVPAVILIITLILTLTLIFSPISSAENSQESEQFLITVKKLHSKLKTSKNLKIIDVRSSGQYLLGHIPKAVQMWGADLQAQDAWVDELIPEPKFFTYSLQQKGINKDSEIIIYSKRNSSWAARLWFIFQFYDYQNVKILKGGYQSWQENNFEKKILPTKTKKGNFVIKDVNNNLITDTGTIIENLNNHNFIILDLRNRKEFKEREVGTAASKTERIPTSINIEWQQLFDEEDRLKSKEELLKIFRKENTTQTKENIVLLSNKGVRAAHGFLILKSLGYQNLKVYDEGWLGWSNYGDFPLEIN